MKNKILNNSILLLLFINIITCFSQTQPRNVAWVHGLDGDNTSWQHYEQIFTAERNINSLRRTYNTDEGIQVASNLVKNSMNYFNSSSTNQTNLGIGHSMGGLMLRNADRISTNNDKNFGGIITVNTPNYGAHISNSMLDGSVETYFQDFLSDIKAGPISQFNNPLTELIVGVSVQTVINYFINNDFVLNLQGNPVVNADLAENSTIINEINSYNATIPRISIWGEEISPVHWRMFSSSKGWTDKALYRDIIKPVRGVFRGFYLYHLTRSVISGIFGFFNPFSWASTALHIYRAVQWKKGQNAFDNSENNWSALIGTTRVEEQTYMTAHWVDCNMQDDYPMEEKVVPDVDPDPNCLGNEDGYWVWEERTRLVSVNYPSDGLLPQYTQELQDIPQGNRYKVEGANHSEVRDMTKDGNNVDETKEVFKLIFNRVPGDFFRTN